MSEPLAVVFLGPSLAADEARMIAPAAMILPPARMGDVMSVARSLAPHAIGLVDGVFHDAMSVFHKELLFALDQGIWVLGAASMGALRAAECDRYGVIGVGSIYERFAAGVLEDDDEVALRHGDASTGYQHLSHPLVTIRAALDMLEARELITTDEAASALRCQQQRYYPDRHVSQIGADLARLGCGPDRVEQVRRALAEGAPDPKADDTRLLLRRLTELPLHAVPIEDRPNTVSSPAFLAALARDTRIATPQGLSATADDLRRHVALHDPAAWSHLESARSKVALGVVSRWLGGDLTDAELDAGRELVARRLTVAVTNLGVAAAGLDLDDVGLSNLIEREAHVLRLTRSPLAASAHGAITAPFLDELRLAGAYRRHRDRVVAETTATDAVELDPSLTPGDIVGSFAALTGWAIPEDLRTYVESQELGTVSELLDSMLIALKASWALTGLSPSRAPDAGVAVDTDEPPLRARGR